MANNTPRVNDDSERKNSKDRIKYLQEWDKEHTTQLMLKLNDQTDADILFYLNSTDESGKKRNKQGLIKSLIRKQIAQEMKLDKLIECNFSGEDAETAEMMRTKWYYIMTTKMNLSPEKALNLINSVDENEWNNLSRIQIRTTIEEQIRLYFGIK